MKEQVLQVLMAILHNKVLVIGACTWMVAQVVKTIIYVIVNKELRWERLVGDGGMPSCHSATVTAVAITTGIMYGFDSPLFAIAAILAIIVMHDAMGVRLETGKQAKFLNIVIDAFVEYRPENETLAEWQEKKFKEFVGHTPTQVVAGALLGLIIALVVNLVLWP